MSKVTSIRAACVVVAAGAALAFTARPAHAATLCVGPGAGCFATIQAAVNDGVASSTGSATVPTGGGSVTVTLTTPVPATAGMELDIVLTGP